MSKADNDIYISWNNMSEKEKAEFFKSNPFKIKKHE